MTFNSQNNHSNTDERLFFNFAELAHQSLELTKKLKEALAKNDSIKVELEKHLSHYQTLKKNHKDFRNQIAKSMVEKDNALYLAAEAAQKADRANQRLKEIEKWMAQGVEDADLFIELGQAANARTEKTIERDKFHEQAVLLDKKMIQLQADLENTQKSIEETFGKIKELQTSLPDPHLFAFLGLARMGLAHIDFLLNNNYEQYTLNMRSAISYVLQMHQELRLGRYRLDRFGDLLAGRHEATVQAIYGAIAIDDIKLAQELFMYSTNPNMKFHHIFNVFRTWLVGSYIHNDYQDLRDLIRVHRYDLGIWRGYVFSFLGLLDKNPKQIESGLKIILKTAQQNKEQNKIPGLDLIHLPVLAIIKLAKKENIKLNVTDSKIPLEFVDD